MATPAYTLSDIMSSILTAIQNILGEVANVLAENATTIATVLVLGGLAYVMVRQGGRIFRGVGRFLSALF